MRRAPFRRMYLFIKGSPLVYADVTRIGMILLKRFFETYFSKPIPLSYKHFNLVDIKDHSDVMFYGEKYNFVTLTWEDGLVDEDESVRILKNCVGTVNKRKRAVFFIFNMSGSLENYFRNSKIIPNLDKRIVWCTPGQSMKDFIRGRLFSIGLEMEKGVAEELAEIPFESLFNIFKIIEYVGLDYVSMSDANRFDLLRGSFEYRTARELVEKGRQYVLNRGDLDRIEPSKFFACVQKFLEIFLHIRGMKQVEIEWGKQRNVLKVELDKMRFLDKTNKKYSISDLWRRYYLCQRLSVWSGQPFSHLLLLYYW